MIEYDERAIGSFSGEVGRALIKERTKPRDYDSFLPFFLEGLGNPDFIGTTSNLPSTIEYPRVIDVSPSAVELLEIYNNNSDELEEMLDSVEIYSEKIEATRNFCKGIFKPAQSIILREPLPNNIWTGDTSKGLNIRPGLLENDTQQPIAVKLKDDGVHLLAGGRTGTGKSVLVNNIIVNTLFEYAPWEIKLYLCDAKKLELSRYGTTFNLPHISVIGATGYPHYFITLLSELNNEMNARFDLFEKLGFTKLSDFRNYFNMVLYRMLLVVDEFTQYYVNSDPKESMKINTEIERAAKLGRAPGLNLFFTSQSLVGTVSADVLTQFSSGLVAESDTGASSVMIGNDKGAYLGERGKGWCIANEVRNRPNNADENKYVKVPFLDSGASLENDKKILESNHFISEMLENTNSNNILFFRYLEYIKNLGDSLGYNTPLSYFNETTKRGIFSLKKAIKDEEDSYKYHYNSYGSLVLGDSLDFNPKSTECKVYSLRSDKNSNIFVNSIYKQDLKYLCDLLQINFLLNKGWKDTKHFVYQADTNLFEHVWTNTILQDCKILNSNFDEAYVTEKLNTRLFLLSYSNFLQVESERENTVYDLAEFYCTNNNIGEVEKVLNLIRYILDNFTIENLCDEKFIESNVDVEEIPARALAQIGLYYNFYKKLAKGRFLYANDFQLEIHWVIAPENMDVFHTNWGVKDASLTLFSKSPSAGILFIFISEGVESKPFLSCSNCLLLGKVEERLTVSLESFNFIAPVENVTLRLYDKKSKEDNYNFKKFTIKASNLSNVAD